MDPWDMDDAALEEAFRAAKADVGDELSANDELDDAPSEQTYDDQDNLEEGSDHDGAEGDVGEAEAEESTDTGSELDGDTTVDEDQPEADEEATETEAQPTQTYKYKANGKEYEFTADEIMKRFPQVFGQAMDYTRKMQGIKPWRQTIDALEQAQLGHEDVNLMIDALRGTRLLLQTFWNEQV